MHVTTTFSLKQGKTRTNSVPIPHPLKLSDNSQVAYRRHCSHCRYRRANLRGSLPSMVNFLTGDRLNTTKVTGRNYVLSLDAAWLGIGAFQVTRSTSLK